MCSLLEQRIEFALRDDRFIIIGEINLRGILFLHAI